jgi:hypothetical protein
VVVAAAAGSGHWAPALKPAGLAARAGSPAAALAAAVTLREAQQIPPVSREHPARGLQHCYGDEMPTATLITENHSCFAAGTNFYRTSDGKHLLVESMPESEKTTHYIEVGQSPVTDALLAVMGEHDAALKMVVRPTIILLCNAEAAPIDADENDHAAMTPILTCDPGTTHEDALIKAGYTLL